MWSSARPAASARWMAPTGRSSISSTLTPADGFIIAGDEADDMAGWSVSSAGDVDGDGFADLIVGAFYGDDGGADAGEAYVLYGGLFGDVDRASDRQRRRRQRHLPRRGGQRRALRRRRRRRAPQRRRRRFSLSVGSLAFRAVDGGTGTDTLALQATGVTLDLTSRTLAARIDGIERIDLTGTGNNILVLDQLAVFNETGASGSGLHVLTVEGNSGDSVSFVDVQWTLDGTVVDGALTFNRYVSGNAEVRIEQGVAVTFPASFDLSFLAPSQGFIVQGDRRRHRVFRGRLCRLQRLVGGRRQWRRLRRRDRRELMVSITATSMTAASMKAQPMSCSARPAASAWWTAPVVRSSILPMALRASPPQRASSSRAMGTDDYAGKNVSSAGDVNGDGFDDLIVGAPGNRYYGGLSRQRPMWCSARPPASAR